MTARTSRLPGFGARSVDERRASVAAWTKRDARAAIDVLDSGGLGIGAADALVENAVGLYALPLAIGLNFRINGCDHLVPMVTEEPSVVAAASYAARLVRDGGGFIADADPPRMVAQIQLWNVVDAERARAGLLAAERDLIAIADASVPSLVARGGGAACVEIRSLGDGLLVVHIVVDVRDAMGANLVNTVAEATAPLVQRIVGGTLGLRILSNLSDQRCVRVRARVSAESLAMDGWTGAEVRDGIVRASEFAMRDPYRAATHNKGVMNGVDAVALATGNDWRAVEAGAHAFAARSGRYVALAQWKAVEDGALVGTLELPLALGIVGGSMRVHEGARLALEILDVSSAGELSMIAASVGLASNLAALRALATEGIQRGHMALHARASMPRGIEASRAEAARVR